MYIRAKNNIYKVESTLRDNSIVKGYNVGEMGFIRKDQVIKQSENLEELCDKFVGYFEIFNRSYYYIHENSYDEFKSNAQMLGFNYSAYGAIWTSKGLIFVAKMNNKGDLELI